MVQGFNFTAAEAKKESKPYLCNPFFMSLITSISGIRGTIGGNAGMNLTPPDVVRFTAAFGTFILQQEKGKRIVVGRDARISGSMVNALVVNTLVALGMEVIDLDEYNAYSRNCRRSRTGRRWYHHHRKP